MFPCSQYRVPAEERRYQDTGIKHLPKNPWGFFFISQETLPSCPHKVTDQHSALSWRKHAHGPQPGQLVHLTQQPLSDTAKKEVCKKNKRCVHSVGPCFIHPSRQRLLTCQAEKFTVTDLLSTNVTNPRDQGPQNYPVSIHCTWMGCCENPSSFGSSAAEPFHRVSFCIFVSPMIACRTFKFSVDKCTSPQNWLFLLKIASF